MRSSSTLFGHKPLKIMSYSAASSATIALLSSSHSTTTFHHFQQKLLPFSSRPISKSSTSIPSITRIHVSSSPTNKKPSPTIDTASNSEKETIFFDGGAHYGDLLANLILGFTLFWLPLTLAAVSRAFFLRYRFTNLRVTVISGFSGEDRSDFSYKVIKDVQVVPRFIGEWGDIVITLQDGTKVDLGSVPKFREIAKYCLSMAEKPLVLKETGPKGF